MDARTYEIRELTFDQPLRPKEILLSQAERDQLQPMNRAQRRAWARAQRKTRRR